MQEIKKLFELLESEDTKNIAVGLALLQDKPDWLAETEKRYLPFIQARLNDKNATIFDFEKAALNSEEVSFLLDERGNIGDDYISFDGIDGEKVKLIVDTIGSVFAIVEDIAQLKKDAYSYNQKDFEDTIETKLIHIKFALEDQLDDYGQTGWFSQIIHRITMLGSGFLNKIYLDHTDFEAANRSLVLDYFTLGLVYLSRFSNDVFIDIAQSTPPAFDAVFWLFKKLPRIVTLDCQIDLPISPLSFVRTVKTRAGDSGSFKSQKSVLPLKDSSLTESLLTLSKFLKEHGIRQDIHKLAGLKKLQLSDLGIATIPEEISKVSKLKELFLSENKLTTLPQSIVNLSALTLLGLDENQLSNLPEDIGQLADLKKLWCSNNQLDTLPDSIANCTKLQELYLDQNNITALPEVIFSLKKLRVLNLENNPITQDNDKMEALVAAFPKCKIYPLPPQKQQALAPLVAFMEENKWHLPIEDLTYMKEFRATDTNATSLPAEIGLLTQLTDLILYDNQIQHLPKEIENLTAVKEIFISHNNIQELPPEIGKLKSLAILRLHKNQLKKLPKEIGQLKKLHTLSLSENPIEEIPEEIKKLKKLKTLKLRETPIASNRKELKRLKELLPNCEIIID